MSHEQLLKDLLREQTAFENLKVLAELLAEAVGPIWHWGDGQGGAVMQVIIEELEKVGHVGLNEYELHSALDRYRRANALRLQVFERDAYRCRQCGDWHDLTLDHIIPQSHGGPTTLENLQTLCRSCNSKKGAS